MTLLKKLTGFLTLIYSLGLVIAFPVNASSLALPSHAHPTPYEHQWRENFVQDLKNDFKNYLAPDNLLFLGDNFLIAGLLANTGLDRGFRQHWQTDIKSSALDNIFTFPKAVGGLSYYYGPIYLITMGVGHLREQTLLGNTLYTWGYRSLRTFILGGIQQVFLTNMLGSGRPNCNEDSKWQPFKYQTGVSGHAFYGAVPFLTAAMMSDPTLLRVGLYTMSVLPGLSRINSDRHYLSQVILGWTLAFLSSRSIYATDLERKPSFQIGIYPKSDGAMLATHLEF